MPANRPSVAEDTTTDGPREAPSSSSPGARRQALTLSLWEGVFSSGHGAATGGGLLAGYLLLLGASPATFAWVTGLTVLAQTFPLLLAPFLDGSRKTVAWSTLTLSRLVWLPLLLLGWAEDSGTKLTLFVALYGLSRVLDAVGQNSWMGWMASVVPARLRGRYFARRYALQLIAAVTAGLTASALVDHFGPSAWSFGAVFGGALALALLSGMLMWYQPELPAPAPAGSAHPGPTSGVPALRRYLDLGGEPGELPVPQARSTAPPPRVRRFLRFLTFFGLWGALNGFASPFWTPFYLLELHLSLTTLALVNATGSFAGALLLPLWGRVIDRAGSRRVLLVTMAWGSFHPLLYLIMTPDRLWPLWVDTVSSGIVWNGFELAITSLLLGLSPTRGGEVHFGALTAVRGLSSAFTSLAAGFVIEAIPVIHLARATLSRFQVIFLATTIMRLTCLAAFGLVEESRSRRPGPPRVPAAVTADPEVGPPHPEPREP